jgi:HlyD family secretion protein
MKTFLGILALVAGLGAIAHNQSNPYALPNWVFSTSQADVPKCVLAAVDRGNVTKTVTASGALSAISTVLVSSQVSGQMLRILADYNTEVQKGDVIAEIDPLSFQIRVEQPRNELAVAEAAVDIQKNLYLKGVADLVGAKSVVESARFVTETERIAFAEAKRDLDRKRLLPMGSEANPQSRSEMSTR